MSAFRQGILPILVTCVTACSVIAADAVSTDANPQLDDPVRALKDIPANAREIKFERGQTVFPAGGHFQGIQAYYDAVLNQQLCFVSSDSDAKGYFIAIAFDSGPRDVGTIRHFQELPSDGKQPPLRHAGGIQLIGNYLVVGVEDNQEKRRSQIQFWDVSAPFSPKLRTPLTIIRESRVAKDKTAGAVGIVRRAGDHLLVVANWDAEALDFYASNGLPLSDDDCRFTFRTRWSKDQAHKTNWEPNQDWGSYQSVNLVSDRDFNIFLFGLKTTGADKDFIDLYAVDLSKEASNVVRKLSSKQMVFEGAAHFRYAGGICIKSTTELSCYATERNAGEDTSVAVSP